MIVDVKASERAFADLVQKVLAFFGGPQFKEEIEAGKKEFFKSFSIPEETSNLFELRMSQFYDWYFFSRPLRGYGQSPLWSLYQTRDLRFSPEEMALVEELKQHRHGIFEFIKLKGETLVIKDLLKNEKLTLQSPNFTFEPEADEIFEARIIPHQNYSVFSKGFCFHPAQAKPYILSEVKRHRKDPDLNQEELMLKLLKMNLRMDQYKHVPIENIYAETP